MTADSMASRISKRVVVASTGLALCLLVALLSQSYPVLLTLNLVAFAAACLLEGLAGDLVLSVLMFATCLAPLMFLVTGTRFSYEHLTPWLSALFGAMAPGLLRERWACPRPLRGALIFWSLALALVWPVLAAREVDFNADLLYRHGLVIAKLGVPPSIAISWMLTIVIIAVVGLLLFETFASLYSTAPVARFEARILWPAFASCLVAAGAATYQSFGHVGFLDPGLYAAMGRASGTLLDANAFGTIAALWLPVACAQALGAAQRRSLLALGWGITVLLLAAGIWSTGSRTALSTGLIGVGVLALYGFRSFRAATPARLLLAVGACIALVATIALFGPALLTGPGRRIGWLVAGFAPNALRATLRELWTRNGYGLVAARMIREHPLVGVGVGSFNTLLADAAYRLGFSALSADNAQNWYRHQLAELGVAGSLGWILWTVSFAWLLARNHGRPEDRAKVAAAKGAVVGLAVSSLVGMPTQHPAVAVTFIVIMFWGLKLIVDPESWHPSAVSRWQAAAGTLALAVFIGGTAYAARHDLRPPYRALVADWDFTYGFYESPTMWRWTAGRAVEVFQPKDRWLKLVIGDGPDATPDRPLGVKVWRDRDLVLDLHRTNGAPDTYYLAAPSGHNRMLIEIAVSRTMREVNDRQNRERGVAVEQWTFVDRPPAGAHTIP